MASSVARLFEPLKDAVRHLSVVRGLPDHFDAEERRLVLQSVVIGVVVWGAVFILKSLAHQLFDLVLQWIEAAPTPFVLFIPLLLGALIVAAIARHASTRLTYRSGDGLVHQLIDIEGDGLERAISLYYASEPSFEQALLGQEGVEVRWRMPTVTLALRKFVATLATLGSGGSGGLEASVTLIGESLAAGLVKPRQVADTVDPYTLGWSSRLMTWWRSASPDDLQTAQLSGISAAVATLLGAPFAAAFFATEIMYRNRPVIEKLIYSLVASLTAFFLTRVTSDHVGLFHVEVLPAPPENLVYYAGIAAMGVVVSLVSVYFSRLRASFDDALHRRQPNIWQRHLSGAAITGAVALLFFYIAQGMDWTEEGLAFILGTGEHAIDLAMAGELTMQLALAALFAKMVATLATIGSGGSAGLLVPSLYFGAMVAAAMAPLLNLEPVMLIVPAMTASLVAIANVPLAAILFSVELFGTVYIVPAMVGLVVTILLSRENTIYRTQRQTYVQRQLLPGYSTLRIDVPPRWSGKTLIDLQLRNAFDVTVVGLLEQHGDDGLPHVRPNPSPSLPLEAGDVLVILGHDDQLDRVTQAVRSSGDLGYNHQATTSDQKE